MLRSLDLNTAAEKGLVKGFTLQTRARLSKLDSNLPQVITVCEMVERGIGVVSSSSMQGSWLWRRRNCYLTYCPSSPLVILLASWWSSADPQRNGGIAFFPQSYQSPIRDRDLCHGSQHACTQCGLQFY